MLSLLPSDVAGNAVPELQFIGCLEQLANGSGRRRFETKGQMSALARGGLRFGGVVRNKEGDLPWLGEYPVPEWVAVRRILKDEGALEVLENLETGCRNVVLSEMPPKPGEDVEYEVPRL